jgi:hypothetical protein
MRTLSPYVYILKKDMYKHIHTRVRSRGVCLSGYALSRSRRSTRRRRRRRRRRKVHSKLTQ